jgi:hypothetical protein
VIPTGDFVLELLSLTQNLGGHKFKGDINLETRGTMADNTGHTLTSMGNRKYPLKYDE